MSVAELTHDARYSAQRIGCTENWLKRNARRFPHTKVGRSYRWTDEQIVEVIRRLAGGPEQGKAAGEGGGELVPSGAKRRAS